MFFPGPQNIPILKSSQASNRPNSKMFPLQNVPSSKGPKTLNVPGPKTSQAPKRPKPQNVPTPERPNSKTSQASKTSLPIVEKCVYFIYKDGPHRDVGIC